MWRMAVGVAVSLMILGCSQAVDEDDSRTSTSPMATVEKRSSQERSPVIEPARAKGVVTGIAVDADGEGVEEVIVTVYRENGEAEAIGTSTTEANGRFTMENVPAGNELVLKAVKKKSLFGVRGIKEHVLVQADKTTDVGKVELKIPTHPK